MLRLKSVSLQKLWIMKRKERENKIFYIKIRDRTRRKASSREIHGQNKAVDKVKDDFEIMMSKKMIWLRNDASQRVGRLETVEVDERREEV